MALALSPALAPCRAATGAASAGAAARRDEQLALWAATPAELPEIGARVGFVRQLSNARAAGHLIDEMAARLERIPDDEAGRDVWREQLRERLQTFGQERLGWPDGYRRLLFGDAFFESTLAFVREAKAFDPELTLEQLGQALRNVWIGNSLQMLLDRRVALRDGLFAYSMLYPLTDNWLDDPEVPRARKRAFNRRFGRRLGGLPAFPHDAREAAAFRLVGRIEAELPRRDFPWVFESLLAIHEGQSRSLDQQEASGLDDEEILAISFEKGGSSVLADLHLVNTSPSADEERFAFGYGVFLQLLDDLQDVEDDLAHGHETLFTRSARKGPLDEPSARLARFIDRTLDGAFGDTAFAERLDLIRRNCRALLVGSVALQPARFSRRFRRALESRWPVSFRAHRRLRGRALDLFQRASDRARAEDDRSPLEQLFDFASADPRPDPRPAS
jgi:hypothetical protein